MGNKTRAITRQDRLSMGPFASPLIQSSFKLIQNENVFTIGSCFARNIESSLVERGFGVPLASFTVPEGETYDGWRNARGLFNKYTPYSMTTEVEAAFTQPDPTTFLLETAKGWLDMQLYTDKSVSLERAVERRHQVSALVRDSISKCRVFIITLGLIEAWFDNKAGMFVNQTPSLAAVKANPGRFSFEVLSPSTTISEVDRLIQLLSKYGRPDQRVIVTVSPVPLGRTFTDADVMVANSYSKSVLRVAAECATRVYEHVDYFPSYESVMFSDRAQAFEEDGVHVTGEAVTHNVGRMLSMYLPAEAKAEPVPA
jgi:hypothetical protein